MAFQLGCLPIFSRKSLLIFFLLLLYHHLMIKQLPLRVPNSYLGIGQIKSKTLKCSVNLIPLLQHIIQPLLYMFLFKLASLESTWDSYNFIILLDNVTVHISHLIFNGFHKSLQIIDFIIILTYLAFKLAITFFKTSTSTNKHPMSFLCWLWEKTFIFFNCPLNHGQLHHRPHIVIKNVVN